jgi:hypothetical protein
MRAWLAELSRRGEFSLGQLVERRDEVDELLQRAEAAGAEVTPAHDRPWGIYSGYFRDPDGHLWEATGTHEGSREASPQRNDGDSTHRAAAWCRYWGGRQGHDEVSDEE